MYSSDSNPSLNRPQQPYAREREYNYSPPPLSATTSRPESQYRERDPGFGREAPGQYQGQYQQQPPPAAPGGQQRRTESPGTQPRGSYGDQTTLRGPATRDSYPGDNNRSSPQPRQRLSVAVESERVQSYGRGERSYSPGAVAAPSPGGGGMGNFDRGSPSSTPPPFIQQQPAALRRSLVRPTSRMPAPQPSQQSLQSSQQSRPPSALSSTPPAGIFGNEPFHDLSRAIGLLKSSKFYAEGFLMKRVEVGADGKSHLQSVESRWAKWFVQLSGTIMSTWNAAEMEEAAREGRTVPPQYLNLSDAFVHPFPPAPNDTTAPGPYQFAMNSAGLNRIIFCAPSAQSFSMWINAIRLAGWERSRCNEIYTGTLLGLREPKNGWLGFENGLTTAGSGKAAPVTPAAAKFEGWLKARLPGDTEWRRVWTVVTKGVSASSESIVSTKKTKRMSMLFGKKAPETPVIEDLPGEGTLATVAFYTSNKLAKKEQPLCILQHLFYAAALYPESEKLIEVSSLFKVEGTFLNPADGFRYGWGVGGRAEKQGMALLMADEGGVAAMLNWIVGLSDAFKLYGRPRAFSFDPRDPSSYYFAMPVGAQRERQFLDRELVDDLEVKESRPRAIRAVFHNILFERMRNIRASDRAPRLSQQPQPQQLLEQPVATRQPRDLDADMINGDDAPQRRFTPGGSSISSIPRNAPLLPAIGETTHADLGDDNAVSLNDSPIMPAGARSTQSHDDPSGLHYDGESPERDQAHASASTTLPREFSPPPPHQSFRTSTFSPPLVPIVTNSPGMNFSRPGAPRLAVEESPAEYDSPDTGYPSSYAHSASVYSTNTTLPRATSVQRSEGPAKLPSPGAASIALPTLPTISNSPHSPTAIISPMSADLDDASRRQSHSAQIENMSASGIESEDDEVPDENAQEELRTGVSHSNGQGNSRGPGGKLPPALDFSTLGPAQPLPDMEKTPRPVPATVAENGNSRAVAGPGQETQYDDLGDDSAIHSDLLAALNFVESSERSDITSPEMSGTTSPHGSDYSELVRSPVVIGPPARSGGIPDYAPASVNRSAPALPTIPASTTPNLIQANVAPVFPSSFAKNKRAEERAAAAQIAQLEQQAAAVRPGRTVGAKGKQKAWQDSDDDEEEEDVDESEDGEEGAQLPPSASFGARNTYHSTANEPVYPPEQHYDYEDDHDEPSARPPTNMVPAVSKYGLLHAGLLDKADRSAKAVEAQARDTGGPLVSLPAKPLPPQTGLVGAITSHQREKERTGGVGKALTEQQRDRKLAEQRQRQLDELQREQLYHQQQQMMQMQQQQQQQQFGGYGGYGMNPMMMNPWMMYGQGMMNPQQQQQQQMGMPLPNAPGSMGPAGPGMPSPNATMMGAPGQGQGQPQIDPQMMQQAMMAAQAAFMQAMSQFQPQSMPYYPQQQQPSFLPGSPLPHSPSLPHHAYAPGQFAPPPNSYTPPPPQQSFDQQERSNNSTPVTGDRNSGRGASAGVARSGTPLGQGQSPPR